MTASLFNITRRLGAVIVAGLLVAGCETDRSPVSNGVDDLGFAPALSTVGFISDDAVVNNYNVHFNGRVFANNATTFSYTVTNAGSASSMSHFTIELPACAGAPSSYSPTGGANINTNQSSGIYGLEWHSGSVPGNFSITFAGDVALGIVRSEVKTENGASGVGDVYGPCAGYHITGNVFVDANESGAQTPEENGIAGVTVAISNGSSTKSVLTDATGSYDFVVKAGTYTVSVDAVTPGSDFNEDLYASFTSHSATAVTKTVGPSGSVDFAFSPKGDKLINDFETGVLTTAGKPAKFWNTEFKKAAANRASTYTKTQLLDFLTGVSAIGRTLPFAFTPGNELKEATNILSAGGNDPVIKMKKQLLAAELNYVAGRTLVNEADLHLVIVLWCEELVIQYGSPANGVVIAGGVTGGGTKETPLSTGTGLLGLVNGSTGGGGGDE